MKFKLLKPQICIHVFVHTYGMYIFVYYFRSFKMQCPAMVYVSVDRNQDKLIVQKMVTDHNHQVSRDVFRKYPEQRQISRKQKELVETMLGMKVKVKFLQDHIQAEVFLV